MGSCAAALRARGMAARPDLSAPLRPLSRRSAPLLLCAQARRQLETRRRLHGGVETALAHRVARFRHLWHLDQGLPLHRGQGLRKPCRRRAPLSLRLALQRRGPVRERTAARLAGSCGLATARPRGRLGSASQCAHAETPARRQPRAGPAKPGLGGRRIRRQSGGGRPACGLLAASRWPEPAAMGRAASCWPPMPAISRWSKC